MQFLMNFSKNNKGRMNPMELLLTKRLILLLEVEY